jgi:hypothetical protein
MKRMIVPYQSYVTFEEFKRLIDYIFTTLEEYYDAGTWTMPTFYIDNTTLITRLVYMCLAQIAKYYAPSLLDTFQIDQIGFVFVTAETGEKPADYPVGFDLICLNSNALIKHPTKGDPADLIKLHESADSVLDRIILQYGLSSSALDLIQQGLPPYTQMQLVIHRVFTEICTGRIRPDGNIVPATKICLARNVTDALRDVYKGRGIDLSDVSVIWEEVCPPGENIETVLDDILFER